MSQSANQRLAYPFTLSCDAVASKKLNFFNSRVSRGVLDDVQMAWRTASAKPIHTERVPEMTHCVPTASHTLRPNAFSVTPA